MPKLDLSEEPLDEAFALTKAFQSDTSPFKVNLGAGVYRNEAGEPWILPSVAKAKDIIAAQPKLDHEYLPIHGSDRLLYRAKVLCFGPLADAPAISSVQTISGTGANHLAALFCAHHLQPAKVFIADPTWVNHDLIWQVAAPDVLRVPYQY